MPRHPGGRSIQSLGPMFSIAVLPKSERGPDGERVGRITVGSFSERFGCYGSAAQISRMDWTWRNKLRSLVDGAVVVALVHDPRFAWIVHREGEDCFVRQQGSLSGKFGLIHPRKPSDICSEWRTSVASIRDFLAADDVA